MVKAQYLTFSTKPTSFYPESFGTKLESIQKPAQNEVTNLTENQEPNTTTKTLHPKHEQNVNIQDEQIERLTVVSKLSAQIGSLSPELGVLTEILGTAGEMGEKGGLGRNRQEDQNERHIYEPHLGYTQIASPESSQKARLNQERETERELMLQQLASEREESPYAIQELINNGEFVAFNGIPNGDAYLNYAQNQAMAEKYTPKSQNHFLLGLSNSSIAERFSVDSSEIPQNMSSFESLQYDTGRLIGNIIEPVAIGAASVLLVPAGASAATIAGVAFALSGAHALSVELARQNKLGKTGETFDAEKAYQAIEKDLMVNTLTLGAAKTIKPLIEQIQKLPAHEAQILLQESIEQLTELGASLAVELGYEGNVDLEDVVNSLIDNNGKRAGKQFSNMRF